MAEELLPSAELDRLRIRAAPAGRKHDVYLWAVIDWHFRTQRPQHLAKALAAAGHRVFYISNNFLDHVDPGFSVEPLDGSGLLFQIHLHLVDAPAIYARPPTGSQLAQLDAGLAALEAWHGRNTAVSVVHHPFWEPLVGRVAADLVVYDCMDFHAGFNDNSSGILDDERRLVRASDLVVVTSQWLQDEVSRQCKAVALVRNGTEHGHFSNPPARVFRDPQGRRVIGYYGAIAHWFDIELVAKLAERFPDALVLLVGSDTADALTSLAGLPNIQFVGEVPYADLPYWLHGFDVCLLPFKVEPLTLATNPVKVYEYLSAGKPVVAVSLPEMVQFEGLVDAKATRAGFLEAVSARLSETPSPDRVDARRSFAARQSWAERARLFDAAVEGAAPPSASVVVVTYNNLELTIACLRSLEENSEWPKLEVIVVDNASCDGTQDYLATWAAEGERRKVVLNESNRGFAAANNQGLALASGDYLVLLNNDTVVTRGWLRGLVNHLRKDPDIGLVGPVTNNIGNEARIESEYGDMESMHAFARRHTSRHLGVVFPIATLAFFCVAMPRSTYLRVGALDEAFGKGFFEDDDYCRRVEQAGLRCVCAEDVFVHHRLSASFDALKAAEKRALFERNKAIYEHKWGEWRPHAYR